jgi:copper chaperone
VKIVQEVMLSVPDVSCQHCVKTIDQALGALSGVKMVSTDLSSKTVHVEYNPSQVMLSQLEAMMDDAGYAVAHAHATNSVSVPIVDER